MAQVDCLQRECDSDRIESIQDNLNRMEAIIENLLALYRDDDSLQTSTVQVNTVARDAWKHVHTRDAQLSCDAPIAVEADDVLLLHVFENLYCNAISYAGNGCKIEVGALSSGGGFYVQDNGPGIPDGDSVVDAGTEECSGNGIGLSLVSDIASMHGWTMTITMAPTGGARFEFSL